MLQSSRATGSVAPSHSLPRPATPLIGREADVAQVRARFEQGARLVTLTGPGGVGKTRLALAVAARLADDLPDSVAFVSLAPIADHRLVVPTVARTLGVMEQADQSILTRLIDHLHDRQLLLVLDNLEHVLAAADSVAELLRACPRLSILVTSREPLHLSGEWEYAVAPLPLPDADPHQPATSLSDNDAVRLFVERATGVSAGFALTDANVPVVSAICHRVAGLPLAIELAASWIKVLPPEELLVRLDASTGSDPLRLLAGGPRDAPTRQQTMRDTIQWSYDLLTPDEQRAFRQLSVFAGGWTVEAAGAVVEHADAFEALSSLIDKSLIQRTDIPGQPARYSMLEPIRQFALELLTQRDEADAVRRRHTIYVLSLVDGLHVRLDGADTVAWLERIESEHDNIRAALRWAWEIGDAELGLQLAGNLGKFWDLRGYLNEGLAQMEAFLSLPVGTRRTIARAEALYTAGRMYGTRGTAELIVSLANEACVLFEKHDDRYGLARSLLLRGSGHLRGGDEAMARADWERAVPLLQDLGNDAYAVRALVNLGILARRHGQLERWRTLIEEAFERARSSSLPLPTAMILGHLGEIAEQAGHEDRAALLYREGLSLYCELGVPWGVADMLELLARLAHRQRLMERAARLISVAVVLREQSGAPHRGDLTVHVDVDEVVRRVRDALPVDTFQAAWMWGQTMTLDEAIEYAVRDEADRPPATDTASSPLTRRELDVLRLLVDGKSNQEIAHALFISSNTVTTHVANIMNKLGLNSRTAVATWAVRQGVL